MNSFSAADLPENKYFEKDALIDKKFIVCAPGVPISAALKAGLAEWNFPKVFSEGNIADASPLTDAKPAPAEKSAAAVRLSDELDALLEEAENGSSPPAEKTPQQAAQDNADAEMEAVRTEYARYLAYTESVYKTYAGKQTLSISAISDRMKEFCGFLQKHRQLVLRMQAEEENSGKTYLAAHSLRSTVFAVVIAQQLNFPPHKLIELAATCLLHEIGMTRLPESVYTSNRPLTETEKKAIAAHPVISYNILRAADCPLSVCLGALEHHERENGTGYPRKLQKPQISIYAKIIAVACSYEAATAHRPFRDGQDAFSGILGILKNPGHQYDSTVVHALLLSLSLYPIGTYVLLTDGRRGQVTDIDPENPKYPVVQIPGEFRADGTPATVKTDEYGVRIVRPLGKEEAAGLRA